MRTLQEKYNAIQEGKFSKDQFLVEARMQQPQLVTRYNGYKDAVQILKNRGMIQESSAEESFADYSNDALNDMIINMSRYEGNEDEIARIKSELKRRKDNLKEFSPHGSIAFSREKEKEPTKALLSTLEVGDVIYMQGISGDNIVVKDKKQDGTVGVGHPHSNRISYQDGNKEVQVVRRSYVKEARLTKNSLTDYRYKPTNDMDKYPYEQILRGLRVELEVMQVYGTPTADEYKKALAKVLKNLEKDEIFYTNQLAGNNKKVDLHDKMVDATAKNTVDTFNGMKKATLKEGIKNLIKKALMENEEDIYEMQGPKSDDEYKSELADYLEDNQIYGYTNRIHNIMTGPDEDEAYKELVKYLDSEGIYGYNRGIERIYADYPYDQHWMNQDEEDNSYAPTEHEEEDEDDIPHPRGYEEASDEESFEDLFESKSLKDLL